MPVRVSTIIPAYNAECTIAKAIDSALSQDFEGHEVVVVNDGSTDSTASILENYGNRIQVVSQSNGGLSAARNAGVNRSSGRYLAFLDADDIWLPGKLETMVSALERNPQASMAFSDYSLIDDSGTRLGESAIGDIPGLEQLMRQRPFPLYSFPSPILPSTWVVPRGVLQSIGGFCKNFKGSGGFDDFWLLLIMREVGEFVYVRLNLTLYLVAAGKPADKYISGLANFIPLVKKRFGASGKVLIRDARSRQCRLLLSEVAHQINKDNRWRAIQTLSRIARLWPAFFLTPEFRRRLFLPQNLTRLLTVTSVRRSRTREERPISYFATDGLKQTKVNSKMSIEVSTIIPAYNAENTIAQAIDSALSQKYEGHEVVVVDDGSTDSTLAILETYRNQIQVVTQPNRGASAARNAGVRNSSGKYLAFLDADDIWRPGKLETMVSALEQNASASLAFSDYYVIDDDGTELEESVFAGRPDLHRLMSELPLPVFSFPIGISPSTWIIPRHVFERSGGFREEFSGQGYEDGWMLLLLRELGEFEYVHKKLTLHRAGHGISNADKYAPSLPVFISLVKARYAAKGRQLIRDARNLQCRMLLSKVAHQMNNRDRMGAICTLVRIAKIWPTYFLRPEFRSRIFIPQNVKRAWDLIAMPNKATD